MISDEDKIEEDDDDDFGDDIDFNNQIKDER